MDRDLKKRIILESNLIIKNNYTLRKVAQLLNISKSTIHNDITNKLKRIDIKKYKKIQNIMLIHKEQRHINGGIATRKKYQKRWNNEEKRKINN